MSQVSNDRTIVYRVRAKVVIGYIPEPDIARIKEAILSTSAEQGHRRHEDVELYAVFAGSLENLYKPEQGRVDEGSK